jgi:regulator of RNase E activity RraB
MKLFKKKVSVQNDDWKFWDFYDEEEFYGLNFLDATYMKEKNQKGFKKEYYLKILIPENKLAHGKFPTSETNDELQKIEDKLIEVLENDRVYCKQVHRCIYFGAKRLLFEVADISEFDKILNVWKTQLFPFELEVIEDEPWVMYNEMQPDGYAWQQMGNREVCEQLVSHGSNPEKIHVIEHAIFGNKANLSKLEHDLIKEGGKTLTFENDMLEIAFESPLDLDRINGMTYFLLDKATEFDCKHDGWCAAIVK